MLSRKNGIKRTNRSIHFRRIGLFMRTFNITLESYPLIKVSDAIGDTPKVSLIRLYGKELMFNILIAFI